VDRFPEKTRSTPRRPHPSDRRRTAGSSRRCGDETGDDLRERSDDRTIGHGSTGAAATGVPCVRIDGTPRSPSRTQPRRYPRSSLAHAPPLLSRHGIYLIPDCCPLAAGVDRDYGAPNSVLRSAYARVQDGGRSTRPPALRDASVTVPSPGRTPPRTSPSPDGPLPVRAPRPGSSPAPTALASGRVLRTASRLRTPSWLRPTTCPAGAAGVDIGTTSQLPFWRRETSPWPREARVTWSPGGVPTGPSVGPCLGGRTRSPSAGCPTDATNGSDRCTSTSPGCSVVGDAPRRDRRRGRGATVAVGHLGAERRGGHGSRGSIGSG
jgi:hypothetical protein